jgi:TolB-like protein/AraC-like DNA-binding protein
VSDSFTLNQIFIRKITDIILANLGNEKFGAKELAHESGMSLYRLNHRLHSIDRKTASQFIRELRLQKALELLQNEAYTISEVAYKSGFNSPSYFTSCFHEHFGYPPGKIKSGGVVDQEVVTDAPVASENRKMSSARKSLIFTSSAILFVVVLFYLVYYVFIKDGHNKPGNQVVDREKSIAVLPIKNLGNNSADQYFYDGIMDEIFINLCKIHGLRVISGTSVAQYRNTTKSISQIAKNLDVNYIVEASGQKYGNTFRLRVQLIEASRDIHIWAEPYELELTETKDFFKIQSRVAQTIALELNATITLEENKLIEKVPTSNMSAYNSYLKANSYQDDIQTTRNHNSYLTAVKLYNDAIKTDSAFAKAYTGLSFAYWNRYYYETYFKEDYLDTCRILANKALSFDDQLDEAYYIKGEYYRVNGQSEEALYNYDKALEINPNYYLAYFKKGYLLTWVLGDYVKGLENFHEALNLIRGDGRSVIFKFLGVTCGDAGFTEIAKSYYNEALLLDSNKVSYLGNTAWLEFCRENFEGALKLKKQQIEMDSTNLGFFANYLGYYCVFTDKKEEAYIQARKLVEMYKNENVLNLQRSHRVGYAFWQVGKKKEAEYYFNQQIKYDEESIRLGRDIDQRKAAQYDLAGTYAFLGDKAKAYKYLDECVKRNTFPLWWVTYIKHDLLFSSLRNEERFQKIVQNVESKYLSEHERVGKWLEEKGI